MINGHRSAEIFTDPDRVIRAMPVKVALGVMGNAWFTGDINRQQEFRDALQQISWNVGPEWNGVAGKVTERTLKKKIDGKTVTEKVEGEFSLAASGAKEIGSRAVRALTNPASTDGRMVRPTNAAKFPTEIDSTARAASGTEVVGA